MLFAYTYVPHPMEKMQEFIEFIFFEVWCKAPGGPPFSLDLFDAAPELKDVMEAFHYSDTKGADFFNGHIERIYGLFADLSPEQVGQLQAWFRGNNDIAGLCRNDPTVAIARYDDLNTFNPPLANELASFFKGLYKKDLLELEVLRNVIGEMNDHHTQFTTVNRQGKCPFCGINDVKGVYHSRREAYDHFLPKGKYPFNSINFHNLAPACHECNSSYKLNKDPLYDAKDPLLTKNGRRKAFYPYQTTPPTIDIEIALNTKDWTNITPDDVNISTGPEMAREEIDTWLDVYGIEERYKAKCCGDNEGKYWIEQVKDEWANGGRTPEEFLTTLSRQAKSRPFAEANFLKLAFLEGCNRSGLFT
ncbi:HNH endonuclease [Desulfosarcina ovata]|uniref:HNH nuclease domain-containing protein n=1 Tax=Desulfosarcina ovata subsp. ovata TaxID=2752305 RepID=A0A5K8AC81_9BACT|nr:hypothetical protein [Desulfosarcina ovata]BBO89624.1 hypothetical protein DSCOOX_28040 [Desulfosarcina ovata subsp. ovata]